MDELSVWLKKYKAFLQNRVSSEDKENKGSYYLTDYCNWVVPGKTKDGIRYALFDMTGDGYIVLDSKGGKLVVSGSEIMEMTIDSA